MRHWKSLGCALVLAAGVIYATGAYAGTMDLLPPRPADDRMVDTAPISAADLQAARSDPRLQRAFELLMGDGSGWDAGVEALQERADAGNPVATAGLCAVDRFGYDGSSTDDAIFRSEAKDWCRRGAEKGYAPAQSLYAIILSSEIDKRSHRQANHWLRLSARQGDAVAWIVLARNYALGKGVTTETAMGTRLIEAVASLPSPIHLYALSTKYRRAIGVQRELTTANAYLQQAAAADVPWAQYDLATDLYLGNDGFMRDQVASERWSKRAVNGVLRMVRDWQPEMGQ